MLTAIYRATKLKLPLNAIDLVGVSTSSRRNEDFEIVFMTTD